MKQNQKKKDRRSAERERTLTPAEQRRKAHFDAMCADFEQKGYTAEDLTIGVVQANVQAVFVMLPFLVLFGVGYLWRNPVWEVPSYTEMLVLFAGVLLLTVVHELIHGLVWGLCAGTGFRAIEFGVIWSALTPYCTCSAPLKRWQYILGSMMPTLVLGFGLDIAAIFMGDPVLHGIALLMMLGGGGDFNIIGKLLRFRTIGKETVFCDHPTACGLVAFTRTAHGHEDNA